ncbi:MAG: heavy metal translocating P-type ATPase, partial [Nitrososphaeraceae archaeon]
ATPVQILLGRPFYIRFYKAIRYRKPFTTDTLVVLSTSIAYGYSLISILTGSGILFFEASASVLTIFTIGEYLEGRVLRNTSESIRQLLALKPKTARVIRNGKEEVIIDADDIAIDDILAVKPGDSIATDGTVIYGESSVDESMVTGESIPVDKKAGDNVIGGAVNKNGYIQFKATKVGSDTVLSHIVRTVQEAKKSKAPVQRIADKAVRYFIPIVFAIALGASLYWLLVAQQSIPFIVTVFATILVVSCPCALGIATPMVVSLGIDEAAREGVLIKGGQYLESLASIDTLVFDKTGTLTKGKPEVTDVIPTAEGYSEASLLQLAASAEIKSEHPIAQAIVNRANELKIPLFEVSGFHAIAGHGVIASYQQGSIFVGSPRISNNYHSILSPDITTKITELESESKTAVSIVIENKLAGIIAISDTLRYGAQHMVDEIRRMGKEVILMSGDNARTAQAIARKVGITNVLSEVSPEAKAQEIKVIQSQSKRRVAMVGDGINDAPALTQADVGIAMGSGTDVAMASGHIIIMKNDLQHVILALKIGRYAFKKIKENLAISFAYNAITMSIAAGVFFGFTNSLVLTPALAALGWIVSDSLVFGNSLRVRNFNVRARINSKRNLQR